MHVNEMMRRMATGARRGGSHKHRNSSAQRLWGVVRSVRSRLPSTRRPRHWQRSRGQVGRLLSISTALPPRQPPRPLLQQSNPEFKPVVDSSRRNARPLQVVLVDYQQGNKDMNVAFEEVHDALGRRESTITNPQKYLAAWKLARLHYIRQRLRGEWFPEALVQKPNTIYLHPTGRARRTWDMILLFLVRASGRTRRAAARGAAA